MAYLSYQQALAGWLNGNEPDDYAASAAAAELVVGGWLLENKGRYSSLSGGPGSLSYVSMEAVQGLIAAVMPPKYLSGGTTVITRGGPDRIGLS